jgi:hypothetical protein
MVNAVRALTQGPAAEALLGHPASTPSAGRCCGTVAIVAIFGPLAVARYRRG